MKRSKNGTLRQVGALPYRFDEAGVLFVLLVTSRGSGRWIIPKGWRMKGKKPHEAARIEAYEEAGIVGACDEAPIGSYRYWKRQDASFALCEVRVYPIRVDRLLAEWPERWQRTRMWLTLEQATECVEEPGLQAMLTDLAGTLGNRERSRRGSWPTLAAQMRHDGCVKISGGSPASFSGSGGTGSV